MIKAIRANFLVDGVSKEFQDQIDSQIKIEKGSCSFRFEFTEDIWVSELFLDIEFDDPIAFWRFLDYSWVKPGKDHLIANTHSPKILKLSSGLTVVASQTSGCWEYQPDSGSLRWYFYHPMLSPTMVYDQNDQRIFLKKQLVPKGTLIQNGLLSAAGSVEEWARTPIGFLPTVCFTDHSDFDTTSLLKVQRKLFSDLGIKVTKGFFLYDYTHKAENASFEAEDSRNELILWAEEGHELAYHALSQSYRGEVSETEFQKFESPAALPKINCYIDHGFHPYNYTKQPLGQWEKWYSHIVPKGINLIWSYIDAGEGNLFTVNQLNPQGYTLEAISKSSSYFSSKGKKRSRKTDLRNFLMYGVPENILIKSKYLKGSLGGLLSNPGLKSLKGASSSAFSMFRQILSRETLAEIKKRRKSIFEVNRFGPVFFQACNQVNTSIQVFQTLSVRDFDIVFSEESLDRLQKESGLMIAHTYFAYTGENHEGRLFKNPSGVFRDEAKSALKRLGDKIQEDKIWNPTVSELNAFFRKFESITYVKDGDNLKISQFDGITKTIA
ncbi:hypothetical protein [Algoriphagus litoralis]|uniref:hypothetical protein n=1 Tax=Algoriphagus litoralis TaxID=2202829 RepID=UPI000DB9399F|nr:hypothetical protein [Algoriphagus litoralis]